MPAAYVLIHLNMSVDFADSLRDIRTVQGVLARRPRCRTR